MDNHTSEAPLKRCSSKDNCIHPNGPLLPATTEYFHRNNQSKSGLQGYCRVCKIVMVTRWNTDHSDRVRETSHRSYIKNKDKRRIAKRHKYAENPKQQLEATRRYRRKHPEKSRAKVHNRNARKREAGGTHTDIEIKAQYKRQRGKCYYCGVSVGKKYHVDHVVPIARGGTNDIANLVIACPKCNLCKGDKLPHEWQSINGRLL